MPRARPVEFHVRHYIAIENLLLRPDPRASPWVGAEQDSLWRQCSSSEREAPGGKPLASQPILARSAIKEKKVAPQPNSVTKKKDVPATREVRAKVGRH